MLRAVADTHTFVWHLFDDDRLSGRAREFLGETAQRGDTIGIAPITLAELVYLVEKNRIPPGTFELACQAVSDPQSLFTLLPFDLPVARALGTVERALVPDMPDRLIAATAVANRLPLITRDGKIQVSQVETIW